MFQRLILSIVLAFALSVPCLAADAPDEELKVKVPVPMRIDFTQAFKPLMVKYKGWIQGFIAIYAFFELFIQPYLEQLELAAQERQRDERRRERALQREEDRFQREQNKLLAIELREEQEERWEQENREFWGLDKDYDLDYALELPEAEDRRYSYEY